jgi:hypothetical protein
VFSFLNERAANTERCTIGATPTGLNILAQGSRTLGLWFEFWTTLKGVRSTFRYPPYQRDFGTLSGSSPNRGERTQGSRTLGYHTESRWDSLLFEMGRAAF